MKNIAIIARVLSVCTAFLCQRTTRLVHHTGFAMVAVLPVFPLIQLKVLVPRAALGAVSSSSSCEGPARREYAGPHQIAMTAPAPNGIRGAARLSFADSPFGVTVTPEGYYHYDLAVQVEGLRNLRGRTPVVWATTPELDDVERIGVLDESGRAAGRVKFNKILVFVTLESSAEVTSWEGPIVLRGISASGLLHTMAGHGPFEGVVC